MNARPEKTDEELVADARMIASALSRILQEAKRRGIECDLLTYHDGKVEITNFERVMRQKL